MRVAAPQAGHPSAAGELYQRDLAVRTINPKDFCVFGPFYCIFKSCRARFSYFQKSENPAEELRRSSDRTFDGLAGRIGGGRGRPPVWLA